MMINEILVVDLFVCFVGSFVLEVYVQRNSEEFQLVKVWNLGCVDGQNVGLMTEWKDLLDQTCAGCVMQQFVQCFSDVCVDDVLDTIQNDLLKLPDDPLIPRVVLLVLEGDIKFEF